MHCWFLKRQGIPPLLNSFLDHVLKSPKVTWWNTDRQGLSNTCHSQGYSPPSLWVLPVSVKLSPPHTINDLHCSQKELPSSSSWLRQVKICYLLWENISLQQNINLVTWIYQPHHKKYPSSNSSQYLLVKEFRMAL